MQKSYSQNNLLGGISVDRDMVKTEPNTLTDAINATVSPEDGSKLVYQSIKSTIPETSIYQHLYDPLLNVVNIHRKELLTSETAREITSGFPVKMKEAFFVFSAEGYDIDTIRGEDNFNIVLDIEYVGDVTYSQTQIIPLKFVNFGDVIDLEVNTLKYISKIQYKINGPSINGYTLGTLEYFDEEPANTHNNVGPGKDKIILGTKTFNDITYFIVGNPDYKTTPKIFENNVGIVPGDHWNNEFVPGGFKPVYRLEDNTETYKESNRDTLTYTSTFTSTTALQLDYQLMDTFSGNGGWFNDTYVNSDKISRKQVGGEIKASGNYTFKITASNKCIAGKSNESYYWVIIAARLVVERDNEVYADYERNSFSYYDTKGWNLYGKEEGHPNITRNVVVTLKDLKPLDRVYLEVVGGCRLRRRVSMQLEAGVSSSTALFIDNSIKSTSINTNMDKLLLDVIPINATSNLHFNGGIEFTVNDAAITATKEAEPPKDIVAFHERTSQITRKTISLKWDAPKDVSITSYDVQYVISNNPDYVVESDDKWKHLGNTTVSTGYDVSLSSLTKDVTGETYYVWFRVAPRNIVRGNWSGGYYRFKFSLYVDSVAEQRGEFIKEYYFVGDFVDPVNDIHKVDLRAVDSEIGSWGMGALPADGAKYEYALDYADFRDVDLLGKVVIHGISPGIHNLYIKRTVAGKSIYSKRTLSIECEKTFTDLKMTVSVEMGNYNQGISNFDLLVTVEDIANRYGKYNIYVSPYKVLNISTLNARTPDKQNAAEGVQQTITVSQKMSKTGNLHIYATLVGVRDKMFVDGLEYQSERHIGQVEGPTENYYKRVVKGTILISEEMKNDKYNLEIGTFPSPFYGHKKGKLINVYQPLQNLEYAAFITNEIKLSGNSYMDMDIQPVYDGSVNVLFTDGEKVPRIVNAGFSALSDGKYELVDHNGGKETNKYTIASVEIATRLVQTENSIVGVAIKSINNSGGHLEVGSYKLLFKLSTVDGNETDFIAETGVIPIFFGDTLGSIQGGPVGTFTHKSIDLTLSKVDSYFNHVTVYVHHATGVNELIRSFYKVNYKYLIKDLISSDSVVDVNITLTGLEPIIKMDSDFLSEQKVPIASIKALAQAQNRLFVANFAHEDIDYNKLFKVGNSILVTPSFGNDSAQLTDIMEYWPTESESRELSTFSSNFLSEKIDTIALQDINTLDVNGLSGMMKTSRSQGYHNPMFVERYAAYWPKETYVFNVVFITTDNFNTRPIPVVGGDFMKFVFTPGKKDNDESILTEFTNLKNTFSGTGWTGTLNNIGACRFPTQSRPNQVFFPKFTFSLDDFNELYPGFSDKFKGFFFTRSERKPDIIMQGFIGPVHATLTDNTVVRDENPTKYVPKKEALMPSFSACVPSLYSGLGLMAFEYSTSLSQPEPDEINWGIEHEEYAGAFVTDMAYSFIGSELASYKDNYSFNVNASNNIVHKAWFKSGDLFADFTQAATDFNGKSYGMQSVSGIDGYSFLQYYSNRMSTKFINKIVSRDQELRWEHVLQALKSSKTSPTTDHKTYKIAPDYRGYGLNSRSPGGFSSLIPFRSLGNIFEDGDGKSIITYLTGAFTAYIGISCKEEMLNGFYDIYSGSDGPITNEALKVIYSVNSNDQHIAITPRYLFEDYLDKDFVKIYGTRGDCFITTTVHNVARSLPAISGNPSSGSSKFTAFQEGSNEPNSYRGSAASMSIMATHASNYLNYARHTEVVDEKESTLYGGPRTFLPLSGTIDRIIGVTHGAKQQETTAFNKGYADNFLGRKYYGISGTSPYHSKKGVNTIAFSGAMSRNSFFNAFREFDLGASKTYGSEMGSIHRLIEFRNNLISVHSNGVYSIGINDQQLISQERDKPIYTGASEVLPEKPMQLSASIGTKYPRSVEKSGRFVYGVDASKGKIWRTDGSNFEIISDNVVETMLKGFLYEMKGLDEIPGERYIATFYEPVKRELIFSLYNKDTKYPDSFLPMQPDIYYFLDNLYKAGMDVSAHDVVKATNLLYHWANDGWYVGDIYHTMNLLEREDRIIYVELYLKTIGIVAENIENIVNDCLTLVYSEDLKIWVTRWNVAPEFMFNHNGITYSVANKQDTKVLPDKYLSFIQDIEAKLVAGDPTGYTRIESSLYDIKDNLRRLIWRHEGFNPSIPMYGSLYGKTPLFELTFIVADEPTREKTFETLSIVGSHSTPSAIMYTMSDDNPLLNKVMSATDYTDYEDWDKVEEAYFNSFGSAEKRSAIYPAMFFKQLVRDRRHNPISRSNAFYSQGRFEITISKGVQPLFMDKAYWERLKFRYFQDKAIKIRLHYESGEEVKVHTLITTFSY